MAKPKAKGKERMLLPIYVDLDVYSDLNDIISRQIRSSGKTIRRSEFVEEKIIRPYLKASKEAGILK